VADLTLGGVQPALRVTKAWKRNSTPTEQRDDGEHRYILGPPKSRRSTRTVTLPPLLVDILRRVTEGKAAQDLVFTAPHGGAWRQPDFYRGRWQVAVARARAEQGLVKRPRFHDLRHTHAVWLITAGVPLPVIQARLGHESIQITVDVYGGFLAQAHAAVDLAITAALGGQLIRPRLQVIDGERAATPPTAAAEVTQPAEESEVS
jgi:integrase